MKFLAILAATLVVVASQGDICPPGEEFWPYPDCSWYYVCNDGNPVLVPCPSGTYWSQELQRCEFPNLVPECPGGTNGPVPSTTSAPATTEEETPAPETTQPPTTTSVPETSPAVTTEEATTEGPVTEPELTTPAPTTTTEATTVKETPETEGPPPTTAAPGSTTRLPPGQCPATGVHKIAHPELCNAYYLCVNGERIEPYMTCAEGLYFDPAIEECNLASEVDCEFTPTTPPEETTTTLPPNACPPEGTHYIPYQGNCTLYMLCIDSEITTYYRCPNGYLFDTQEKICKPESEAVCTVTLFDTIFEIHALQFDASETDASSEEEISNNAFQHMHQNLFKL